MEKPIALTKSLQFALYLLAIIVLIGVAVLLSSFNNNLFKGDVFGKVTQVVEGSICQIDADCAEGVCVSNVCIVEKECVSDEDCGTTDATCVDNVCVVRVIVSENTDQFASGDEEDLSLSSTSAQCVSDSDCKDDSACTRDICLTEAGTCTFIEIRCGENERCVDGNCVLIETETTATSANSGSSGGNAEEQNTAVEESVTSAGAETSTSSSISSDSSSASSPTSTSSTSSTSSVSSISSTSSTSSSSSVLSTSSTSSTSSSAATTNSGRTSSQSASTSSISTPQCNVNEDCPIIQFCDLTDNTCKDGCRTDDDCFGGKCVSGNCQQSKDCIDDLDCNMDEICNQGLCILADTGSSLPASTIPPAAPTAPTTTPQAPPKTPETSAPIVQEPAQVPIQPAPVPSANIPVKEAETNTALSSEIQPPVLPADGQALKCTKATQHIDCSVGFACSEASLTCFEECKNSVGCQPGFSCFDSFCNIDFLDCKSDKDCPLGMFCSAMYEICQQCDDQHACANVKFTCDPLGVCYDSASASVDYGSSDDDSSGEEEGAGFDESSAGFVDSGYEDYGFDDGSGEYDDGSGYPPLDAGMLPDDGLPADGLPADAGLDQGLTTDGYTDTGYDSSAAGYDSSQDSSTQDPSQDYQSGYTDSALNQQGTSGQDQGQSANANLLLGQAGAGAGTSTTTDEQGLGALWWGLILFVTLGMVSGMAVLANKRVDFKNISLKNLFSKHAPAAGSASNMLSGQQPLDAASPSLTQPKIMQETSASANFTSPLQTSPQYPSSTNVSPEQKIDPYIEQQFTSYVESHINAGATKDQLYGLFIRAGWDKKTLDYLFDKHCLLFITPEERQQIENYIRFYVGKGLSRDSIRQGLVNAGWDQRVIEELMKEY